MKASLPLPASSASLPKDEQMSLSIGNWSMLSSADASSLDGRSSVLLQDGSDQLNVQVWKRNPARHGDNPEKCQSSFFATVDEQLSEWNADTWCDRRNADPFELDWLCAESELRNI